VTEAVQIALIVSIAPTIAATGSLVLGLMNRKKIDGVAHAMNHLLDIRVDEAKALGTETGRAAGIEQERNRDQGH
jgi:hypothetical protein